MSPLEYRLQFPSLFLLTVNTIFLKLASEASRFPIVSLQEHEDSDCKVNQSFVFKPEEALTRLTT